MNSKENRRDAGRHLLPFLVEFVKFATGFAVILALALIALHSAAAAAGIS